MKLKIAVLAALGVFALVGVAEAGVFGGSGGSGALARRQDALVHALSSGSGDGASISSARGHRGPRGFQGPRGVKGATGATGATGAFAAITQVSGPTVFLCGFETGVCAVGSSVANCPAGTTVIGGGWAGGGISATVSYDAASGNSWGIVMTNDENTATNVHAIATCATP